MRDSFCVFILTHGRADRVTTYDTLRKRHGYTGKIYIVIDDEDDQADNYRKIYGDSVLQFSKSDIAETFDEGDNFSDRRAIVYARNACFDLAKDLGCKHFIQLDDDYTNFYYRFDENGFYGSWWARLDWLFAALCNYLDATPFLSIAISQGGDHIGGGVGKKKNGSMRKVMNTFVCSTDRPFKFSGRLNEDVNIYTCDQRRGSPFLSFVAAQVNQKVTQTNAGGMTDIYLDRGTYVKSFYSVMYCPSAVKIGQLKDAGRKGVTKTEGHSRVHHSINWTACAPKIIREKFRKG